MTDGEFCTVDRPAYDIGRGDHVWWEGAVRYVHQVMRVDKDEVEAMIELYLDENEEPVTVAANEVVEVVL